jgi:hypothetical protein
MLSCGVLVKDAVVIGCSTVTATTTTTTLCARG